MFAHDVMFRCPKSIGVRVKVAAIDDKSRKNDRRRNATVGVFFHHPHWLSLIIEPNTLHKYWKQTHSGLIYKSTALVGNVVLNYASDTHEILLNSNILDQTISPPHIKDKHTRIQYSILRIFCSACRKDCSSSHVISCRGTACPDSSRSRLSVPPPLEPVSFVEVMNGTGNFRVSLPPTRVRSIVHR